LAAEAACAELTVAAAAVAMADGVAACPATEAIAETDMIESSSSRSAGSLRPNWLRKSEQGELDHAFGRENGSHVKFKRSAPNQAR
jgi:hypothetical protein